MLWNGGRVGWCEEKRREEGGGNGVRGTDVSEDCTSLLFSCSVVQLFSRVAVLRVVACCVLLVHLADLFGVYFVRFISQRELSSSC